MTTLAVNPRDFSWELRTAWATRREVVLRLDEERAIVPRVRGWVERVAASGAFVLVADGPGEPLAVPLEIILAVRSPHFHEGDPVVHAPERSRDLVEVMPGQLQLIDGLRLTPSQRRVLDALRRAGGRAEASELDLPRGAGLSLTALYRRGLVDCYDRGSRKVWVIL